MTIRLKRIMLDLDAQRPGYRAAHVEKAQAPLVLLVLITGLVDDLWAQQRDDLTGPVCGQWQQHVRCPIWGPRCPRPLRAARTGRLRLHCGPQRSVLWIPHHRLNRGRPVGLLDPRHALLCRGRGNPPRDDG
jgi:hypothetical protein